jgi:hypothetical protein
MAVNLFKTLFSSDKLIDNASAGIDKMVLTKEEQLDNFQVLLQLYTPFKIAQRILAIIFCVPYALAWVITFIAGFYFPNTTPMIDMLSGDMGTIVGIIVAFYFGGGAVEGVIGKFKGSK